MTILISNDDGIDAKGLISLRNALSEIADVIVIAPDRQQSASSHSLTLHKPLRVRKIDKNNMVVDGTPTDCVMLAVQELLTEKPALVVSGINHGGNLGDDVTYSGTVAVAFEGTLLGIPSIAISLDNGWQPNSDFTLAAQFAKKLVSIVLEKGLPTNTLLNVNVPHIPLEECKGVAITRLGRRHYKDVIVKKHDPRGKPYYWIAGTPEFYDTGEDTDVFAIKSNKISITPLHLDCTHYESIETLKKWSLE